jgi:hypothetical protein
MPVVACTSAADKGRSAIENISKSAIGRSSRTVFSQIEVLSRHVRTEQQASQAEIDAADAGTSARRNPASGTERPPQWVPDSGEVPAAQDLGIAAATH